ncbi:MAG TPA: sodium-dependent transporter [Longimicrobiaceae bacterium]|nr:sodium-dependent transporter [Longimicrobiaceae bacterium]
MSSDVAATHAREHWGTRIGLILAMAGNAVGLGNFLRFPVQAATNGGGTFMIPYFISFILLGIPLMWMEWGIGRYGGRFGHGTIPGMFDRLWRHPVAKYMGVIGVIMPLIVFVYYTVIVGWLLGFAFFSITGSYFGLDANGVRTFLGSFQNIHDTSIHGGWVGFLFYGITLAIIVWVLSRGISGGIEKLALIGMPILFIFAVLLAIRVVTLPETAVGNPSQGLAFIWTPDWGALGNASVWLAAAGQVFFTLSLGMGTIQTYSSFLSKDDDVTLTGLTTASTNEFAEVVLGGTIAIPAAVTFFGVAGATAIAAGGSCDLGIVAMGVVFQNIPGGQVVGQLLAFMWFFLLFIAGITSSVALASPAMAFMQEEFGVSRKKVALGVGGIALFLGLANIWWLRYGFLDEWDFWAGTFGLVLFAFIEVWIIRLAFGVDEFWDELHLGADLRVPIFFKFVMKWVTPVFLTGLLAWWMVEQAIPVLLLDGVASENVPFIWLSRLFMAGLFAVGLLLIGRAWKTKVQPQVPSDSTLPAR